MEVPTILLDLKARASDLDSDMVSKRKTSYGLVKDLLENSELINVLNKQSRNENSLYTWTDLWKAAHRYTQKEADKWLNDLEKANNKAKSASSISTIQNNKTYLCSMMTLVLKKCQKSLIKTELMIDQLISFLGNSPANRRVRETLGSGVIDIFLKRIFNCPSYLKGFRVGTSQASNQWKNLVQKAFELFDADKKIEDLGFNSSCRFLYQVIILSNIYSSTWEMVQRRLPLFENLLQNEPLIREISADSKFVLLKMINSVQDLLKRENRLYLCQFGEKHGQRILGFCKENNCYDEVVKFFICQLSLHHPQGESTKETGAYFHDEQSWKQLMLRIYVNLIETPISNKIRSLKMKIKGSQNYLLEENILLLGSQVGLQLFCHEKNNAAEAEVTQIIPMDVTQSSASDEIENRPAKKKRRIETSWLESFFIHLKKPDGIEDALVPWLQILNRLIPFVQDSDLQMRLNKIILDLVQSCKSSAVKDQLFQCASSIIQHKYNFKMDSCLTSLIWNNAMHSVGLNQCIEHGSQLLKDMIIGQDEGVQQYDELFNQYLQNRIRCCKPSIKTLIFLVKKRSKFINSLKTKQKLLNWLTGDEAQHWSFLIKDCPMSVVTFIMVLVVQGSSLYKMDFSIISDEISKDVDKIKTLETRILESNLCLKVNEEERLFGSKILGNSEKLMICDIMKQNVKDFLVRKCGETLEKFRETPNNDIFEIALDNIIIVIRLLEELKMADQNLINHAKTLCQHSVSFVKDVLEETKVPYIDPKIFVTFDIWQKFTTILSSCGIVQHLADTYSIATRHLFDFCYEIKAHLDKEDNIKRKRTNGFDSDDEDFDSPDTISNELDKDDEEEEYLQTALKKAMISLGSTLSTFRLEDELEDFIDFMDELINLSNPQHFDTCDLIKICLKSLDTFKRKAINDQQCAFKANAKLHGILQKLARKIMSKDLSNYDPMFVKSLFDLVSNFIGHLAKDDHQNPDMGKDRRNAVKFVMGFILFQRNFQRYSPQHEMGLIDFIGNMSLSDPGGNWTTINSKIYEECSHDDNRLDPTHEDMAIVFALTKFTRHPCNDVREHAISWLVDILKKSSNIVSKRILAHITKSLENWTFFGDPNELFLAQDEKLNRISSKLKIYSSLLHLMPSFKLPIITQVVRIFIRDQVPLLLQKNMIQLFSKQVKNHSSHYEDKNFMVPFIDHLINDYLISSDDNYCLKNFPYVLFNQTLQEFICDHQRVIVPLMLWHCDLMKNGDIFDRLCQTVGKSRTHLIKNNFVTLASIYISSVINSNDENSKEKKLEKIVEKHLSQAIISEMLNDNFGQIVGYLLRRLADAEHFQITFGFEMADEPHIIYPGISVRKFKSIVAYFHQNFGGENGCLFNNLLSIHPDTLQNLFSVLIEPLKAKEIYLGDCLVACQSLFVILETIASEIQDSRASSLRSSFSCVTWFVVSCLIRLKDPQLKLSSMSIIMKLLEIHSKIDENWCGNDKVLSKLILPLTSHLINIVIENEQNDGLVQASFKCLNFIIIQNGSKFSKDFMRSIGRFPQHSNFPQFDQLNQTIIASSFEDDTMDIDLGLREELQDFERKVNRLDAIESLRVKLVDSRSELNAIASSLRSNDSILLSENIKANLIYKTVRKLINISKDTSLDDNIRIKANECLGIIGPVDLNIMVLDRENNNNNKDFGKNDVKSNVVRTLMDYVIDNNHETSNASVYGLKRVLAVTNLNSLQNSKIEGYQVEILRSFMNIFSQAEKAPNSGLIITNDTLNEAINQIDFWPIEEKHDIWMKNIVVNLLKAYPEIKEGYLTKSSSAFGRHLLPLALRQPLFCEKIFPWLIHDILKTTSISNEELSKQFGSFFFKFYISKGKTIQDFRCVEIMLELVKFLRRQSRELENSWKNNFWIQDLNYLHVAFAAFESHDYISCIIFCDIWCQSIITTNRLYSDHWLNSLLDGLYDHFISLDSKTMIEDIKMCQNLMADSYLALGEKAAVEGCGSNRILAFDAQVQHLMYKKEHSKAMAMEDANIIVNNAPEAGLLKAMKEASYDHTLVKYQQSCADALTEWTEELCDIVKDKSYFDILEEKINIMSLEISKEIKNGPSISTREIYNALTKWRTLVDYKTFKTAIENDEPIAFLDNQFQDYKYVKPITTQRLKILSAVPEMDLNQGQKSPIKSRTLKTKQIKSSVFKMVQNHCLNICELGRKNEDFNFVYQTVTKLDGMKDKFQLDLQQSNDLVERIHFERCLLFWSWGEKDMAIKMMKGLMKKTSASSGPFKAESLTTMASWLWNSRSASAQVIQEDYYQKAMRIYEQALEKAEREKLIEEAAQMQKNIADSYLKFGTFCDEQYSCIDKYMKSKEFEEKQDILEKISKDSELRKKQGFNHEAVRAASIHLDKNSKMDIREVKEKKEERNLYLKLALQNYAKTLMMNDKKSELKVYRLVGLWFSNMEAHDINKFIEEILEKIPEDKFVGILYQLCGRVTIPQMNSGGDIFQKNLQNLIFRCGKKHPYHALPIILALANANADEEFIQSGANGGKLKSTNSDPDNQRSTAAKNLLKKLKNENGTLNEVAVKTEQMSLALVNLAYSVPKTDVGKIRIPSNQPLLKLKNLENVLLPTHTLKLSKEAVYLNTPQFCGIYKFQGDFTMVGGINAPKKIYCVGTDGKPRPQLIKGKDDLRQDAVMQQVFGLMNDLLNRNLPNGKLHMRTFKVVPLSQRSGILEWCVDTIELGEYLLGPKKDKAVQFKLGAHQRYHPEDINGGQAMSYLKKERDNLNAQKNKPESQKRLEMVNVLKKICLKFKPVFRHFFFEKFPDLDQLLERRLAYTRSCATSSMIGYILGLGDRHVYNILVDQHTAEVVHIDFGYAFDQSKSLPTPETVPFRLTRDIIDGFGPCGVEGTFRKSAEAVMQVLRSNQESILTILEVLIFDPLYNWSITPEKAYRIQHGKEPSAALKKQWAEANVEQSINKLAERALMRISQKLNGMEESYHMSVEGQVNSLIQQATDHNNLAFLYHGWQAYV